MESIFDIVAKYGWNGVLAAAVLCTIYLLFKYISKKMDSNQKDTIKGMEKIATSITTCIVKQNNELVDKITNQQDKLLDFIIKDKSSTQAEHKDMLVERMQLTEDIKQKLKDIMHIHNAQRAYIIEFHNSYQNLTGIPFAKYSCTYEWFDKGLQSLQGKCLSLPFSSMSSIVRKLLNEPEHILIYKDMKLFEDENPSFVDLLNDSRTIGIIYSGMFDNKNQLIGCLVIEYQKEIPENLQINNILLETAELTQVINLRYKYQKTPIIGLNE